MGNKKFKTFDPALNIQNEWEMIEATGEEIDKAISLADLAFFNYKSISDEKRAKFLKQIAANIEEQGNDLLEVYCKESGLSLSRARAERGRTTMQLRMFADFISQKDWRGVHFEAAEPDRQEKPKPSLLKTYVPLGPIAVFGASNFPFAYSTAGGDTASALAVGCPVIVKSHPMHAGTGELVAKAIIQAAELTGMPNGVFSNLNSQGIEVGEQLVKHPKIKGVGFTGSIKGGRALYDLAAQRDEPIPVFAEMGSINPVIISKRSIQEDKAHWVSTYAESITNGAGQFCTNPGLLIGIESDELDEFAEALARELSGRSSGLMLNPAIKDAFGQLRKKAISSEEVEQLTSESDTEPNYALNTIARTSGKEFLNNPQLHQEVFGPYSLIVSCHDEHELIKLIDAIEGQLTGTVIFHEEEQNRFRPIIHHLSLRVGRVIYNGVPTGVEVTKAMTHGGPYPASTDSRFTAVGTDSCKRWMRPITFQNFPDTLSGIIPQ